MANGKVTTGFSHPYVAKYSCENGSISYSNGMVLARGVDVTISPESSSDNNFYADNIVAESASGMFTGGTISYTVDGLLADAEKFIFGLNGEDDSVWTAYDNTNSIPYVGTGFVARQQSDGAVTYCPIVLARVQFSLPETSAATQEEDIDWQTQTLEATIFRAEDTNQTWKWVGKDYDSETDAISALENKLSTANG